MMKNLDYTQLDSAKSAEVVKELQVLLADLQLFYTNLRGFHWNVKGPNFFILHEKYEELYDDVADKVDEVAERILMLDGTPAHNFSEYLKVASIKETSVVSEGTEITKLILDYLKTIIAQERKAMNLAADANDEATEAMMSDYIREQEKLVWMLNATLA